MKEKLCKLIDVKSIMTIILTLVFAYLSIIGKITPEAMLQVYLILISFYFGTQTQKVEK